MDKLDLIFDMQKNFMQDLIKNRHLENISQEEWIQKLTLAIISELAEVLDEVNFKWWKNSSALNSDNLKNELVDILHFFVDMCLHAGMTAEELQQRYMIKNKENFDRQYGLSKKTGYEIDKK